MILQIILNQSDVTLKLLQNKGAIDPALFEDYAPRKNGSLTVLKRCGVDFETAKYYHDLSEVLTPLEVSDIIKKGFIIKDGTAIYGQLLTGLISCLDKLLKRNKLDFTSLKSYKIQGDVGQNSTSYKITAAFIGGLKIRF